MIVLTLDVRYLLLLFVIVQSVYLYRIYPHEENPSGLTGLALNENSSPSVQTHQQELEDDESNLMNFMNDDNNDESDALKLKSKRATRNIKILPIPQRRNNRPHWNPLVAAYKRCGEFLSQEKREHCFKDAVQMLFVHKLRK